ncbi:MAG: 16S ribosomal RNA methyltransferase A [Methanomicrobiales archaeon]|nr:16S ribosomal RNA methyltransferase A [Methanomicrobiales archaeon]
MSAPRDQHFLIDPSAVERILSCIEVGGCRILEIGPGRGILTRALLDRGATVVAVELDYALCRTLESLFSPEISRGRLLLVQGDAVRCALPPFEKVVSNLPYSVSSRITFRLLDVGFSEAILMYQKEFAERMVTKPGTSGCGRLSIMAQTYAEIEPCFEISPQSFNPMPKVRSLVLRLIPHEPRFPLVDRTRYNDIVRVLFSHRRKTVRNGLKSLRGSLGSEHLEYLLSQIPEDILSSRPEELQLEDFALLANAGLKP